ncbi:ENR1 protein, partial [Haliaeetus albicilla]|nr:ENR1 protein [Haliaeetus albicilla]
MLNRIIRLQAVVEIVVNKTGDALGLIAKQNTKMRTALYQNRLALDKRNEENCTCPSS